MMLLLLEFCIIYPPPQVTNLTTRHNNFLQTMCHAMKEETSKWEEMWI